MQDLDEHEITNALNEDIEHYTNSNKDENSDVNTAASNVKEDTNERSEDDEKNWLPDDTAENPDVENEESDKDDYGNSDREENESNEHETISDSENDQNENSENNSSLPTIEESTNENTDAHEDTNENNYDNSSSSNEETENVGNINSSDDASENQSSESVDNSSPSFIQTGIPGFDNLIDSGGIPSGTAVLLSGGPGSGKTTFSLQTLYHGASNGEKCIYLSFEESVERLKSHMKNYGWDPDKLIDEGNLIIKRMDPFEISRSVEALLAKARGELLIDLDEVEGLIPKDFHPSRIVLDSLSAVSAAFAGREEGYRIYIEQLFKALENIGATSFLITEINHDMNTFSRTGVEEFLSDGVIAFYNIRKGNIRVSATEIVKLRGVSHKKRIVPFNISSGRGIEVFPTEEIFVD